MHKYTSTSRKRRGSGEVEGGSGTKAPTLQGHLSKIENVNNETVGWGGGWNQEFETQTIKNAKEHWPVRGVQTQGRVCESYFYSWSLIIVTRFQSISLKCRLFVSRKLKASFLLQFCSFNH